MNPHNAPHALLSREYMVSAVVRGSPTEVLDVLMHNSANTTILGPATKVEVLGANKDEVEPGTNKEVGWQGSMMSFFVWDLSMSFYL